MLTLDLQTSALQRSVMMLQAIAPDLDATQFASLYQVLQVTASQDVDVLASLQNLINQMFVSTATGLPLQQHGLDQGVQINGATGATGSVTLYGSATPPFGQSVPSGGWPVPQGTRVYTAGSVLGASIAFQTTAAVNVPAGGTATVGIVAEQLGAAGNVAAGAIVYIDSIPGITGGPGTNGVYNALATSGGADQEQDTAYRGRIKAVRQPLYSVNAVTAAAATVPGVAYAYVFDPQDGTGINAIVYAADINGQLSSSLNSAVLAAVNGVLPLTQRVQPGNMLALGLVSQIVLATIALQPNADPVVTTNAVVAAMQAFSQTLGPGVTLQPGPLTQYVMGQVSGLADFYLTSAIPTLNAHQLFRFIAAPTGLTITPSSTGGSMSNSTVYVQVAYYNAANQETARSLETAVVLNGGTSTQSIAITLPTFPNGITGAKIYASTVSGSETSQGTTTTSGGTYTLTSVASGSTPPTTTITPSNGNVTVGTV